MKGLVWQLPGASHPEVIFGDGRGKQVNLDGGALSQIQGVELQEGILRLGINAGEEQAGGIRPPDDRAEAFRVQVRRQINCAQERAILREDPEVGCEGDPLETVRGYRDLFCH